MQAEQRKQRECNPDTYISKTEAWVPTSARPQTYNITDHSLHGTRIFLQLGYDTVNAL